LPRFDHRVAAEPWPPKRPVDASGGRRRSTDGDTSHPGGRSPSGAPQRAPSAAAAGAGRRARPFPQERPPRFSSGRCPVVADWPDRHALIQCGASLKPYHLGSRRALQAAFEARCRREATGEALPTQPAGGRHRGLGPFSKEGRIRSAAVRIPGPDNSGRSGVDTDASTSAALVPCGIRALRFHRRRTNPTARHRIGVAVTWLPGTPERAPNGQRRSDCDREVTTGAAAGPCGSTAVASTAAVAGAVALNRGARRRFVSVSASPKRGRRRKANLPGTRRYKSVECPR
jgi:hypothetical protein